MRQKPPEQFWQARVSDGGCTVYMTDERDGRRHTFFVAGVTDTYEATAIAIKEFEMQGLTQ